MKNKTAIKFRILPKMQLFYYPQFKDSISVFGYKFIIWRYIPNSIVSGVASKKQCPWLYLPFTTSHCFVGFLSQESAVNWVDKNRDLDKYFDDYMLRFEESINIKYL